MLYVSPISSCSYRLSYCVLVLQIQLNSSVNDVRLFQDICACQTNFVQELGQTDSARATADLRFPHRAENFVTIQATTGAVSSCTLTVFVSFAPSRNLITGAVTGLLPTADVCMLT